MNALQKILATRKDRLRQARTNYYKNKMKRIHKLKKKDLNGLSVLPMAISENGLTVGAVIVESITPGREANSGMPSKVRLQFYTAGTVTNATYRIQSKTIRTIKR